jgi:hypothetical protein
MIQGVIIRQLQISNHHHTEHVPLTVTVTLRRYSSRSEQVGLVEQATTKHTRKILSAACACMKRKERGEAAARHQCVHAIAIMACMVRARAGAAAAAAAAAWHGMEF